MSADSAVTYTSVHSEARSWSIPSEDPYEEAPDRLLSGTTFSRVVPDPMEWRIIDPTIMLPIHGPPSTSRRADILEADTPPWKRLLLTTPRPGCEIGESYAAATARQPGPTMAHRVDHSHVDTMETRVSMILEEDVDVVEMVELELQAVRAEIEVSVEEERRVASRAMRAADDLAVQYIMRTQALEAGARVDTLEDTGSSS
ncbi:hypothetical protein Tco_1202923 [Tanacetum coccineum]